MGWRCNEIVAVICRNDRRQSTSKGNIMMQGNWGNWGTGMGGSGGLVTILVVALVVVVIVVLMRK